MVPLGRRRRLARPSPRVRLSTSGDYAVMRSTTITKGDNHYASIAAASMLAKAARDDAVLALCTENPELDDRYGWVANKGYGTARHLQGLQDYGPTPHHRLSFARCS